MFPHLPPTLARALPILASASAFACVQVEADLPVTCFVQSDVSIGAVAVDGVTVQTALDAASEAGIDLPENLPDVAVEQSFTRNGLAEIPQAIEQMGAEASLALLHVDVTAVEGLDTFEGIERVVVTMAPTDPAAGLEPAVLARCDRAEGCDVFGATVRLAGDAARDVLPYMRAGELEFTLELAGQPPLRTWAFDVDVCLKGEAALTHQF